MSSILFNQLKINEKVDEIKKLIKLAKKQGEYDISYLFNITDPYYLCNSVVIKLEEMGYYVKMYPNQDNKIYIWWED